MLSIDIPSTGGIYRILCVPTGRFYIGSATNLHKRTYEHLRTLRHGTHSNSKLQRAWNKYGEENFLFEILEYILLPDLLVAREQYWLDKTQAVKKGFNLSPTADSRLGFTFSQESRERMRQSHLGQPSARLGCKASPETLERMSRARKGKPGPNLGRKFSPEACARIGKGKKGKPNPHEGVPRSPETRAKIAAAGIGRTYTPETIEKVRVAKIGNTNGAKDYIVTSPEGEVFVVHNLKAFCKEHNLIPQALGLVASGKRLHHKGWKARYADSA